MSRSKLSRRSFLAAGATALAAPYIIPARAFGANERIVTAHIGVGGQGTSNLNNFLKQGTVPAALCDVDKDRLAKAVKLVTEKGHTCDGVGDYRRLLDRKDIDAVVVTTPDHWHALTTIHACQAGKDVYCEKPLSLTVVEGRRMVEAARDNKRIVQTGSQQRSDDRFRLACELVRSGRLGELKEVHVGIPACNFSGPPVADSTPPAALDYDMWLGPAPARPYNEKRVHYLFRFFWDYSGGQMTNFGAHHLDIAQWALDMDNSGPVSVEGTAEFHPQQWYEVTSSCRLTYTYATGVKVVLGQQQEDIKGGCKFIGTKGSIFVDRGKIVGSPEELVKEPLPDNATRLYASKNHHQDFLDCMKSRKLPICDVEIGHRSATVCHLGNIAARIGRKVEWDPATEQILRDPEAAKMLSRPYRSPWTLG
ncbi:MAG TPA: Gfo/Idh/MocA family oxidoreductase [Planctomycetaceae bacterium]|nr:Gfo/Idh/MocA family oxidoreductase [Planctomycetaceae bacterium]